MAEPTTPPTPDELRQQAMGWRVRLADEGRASSPPFEAWLARGPAQRAAWAEVDALWTDLGGLGAAPEMGQARRDALARARRAQRAWGGGAVDRRAVAAGLATAVAGAIFGSAVWARRPRIYETAVGERRVVGLADGSTLTLDSASRVEARFTDAGRDLILRAGQARFYVTRDPARPFRVRAGERSVVALGTSFDVEILGPEVRVTLLEGRVSVLGPGGTAAAPVSLRPGQRLVAGGRASENRVAAVDVEKARAWESGVLVFEDETLRAVAARVSRYSERPVVIADEDLAELRVSGVFRAGDLRTFLDTVTEYLPLKAGPGAGGSIALTRS